MNRKDEYLMLKKEIDWRLQAVDNLGIFMYTVFATIIGFALSMDMVELLLLPYVIIVPVVLKVANHKYSVGYIAGYLCEILEDNNEFFQWETLHKRYYHVNNRRNREKVIYYGSSFEYILMSVLTAILFWAKYHALNIEFTTLQIHLYIFLQLGIIIFVSYITFSYMNFQKFKSDLFENWSRVKSTIE